MKTKLEIYTDGGARNNPGPAGIGVVIGDKEYGEYIGETTNNVAEYKAIIFALKKTRHLLGKSKLKDTEVIVNSDSELAVNQLNGKFKILEKDLQPLFLEIWNLRFDFPNLQFKHVRREKNQRADYLVNQAINKQQNTLNI
ncbi:MAG: ribonuclease HI family protein [Candidatus Pacebacteria bacterium]|nr:ribonuclease HI family protein [Candidatus Paceibacterota bacterium]MDD5721638.1 ribonuclease HI family protein [Candidatus Paceibacterota bacterium]